MFCKKKEYSLVKNDILDNKHFLFKFWDEEAVSSLRLILEDIEPDILNKVDYAVNLKRDVKLQEPSKIVKIENDEFITLRD